MFPLYPTSGHFNLLRKLLNSLRAGVENHNLLLREISEVGNSGLILVIKKLARDDQ